MNNVTNDEVFMFTSQDDLNTMINLVCMECTEIDISELGIGDSIENRRF